MNLAWRATLVTVAASAVVVLVACTSDPTPSAPAQNSGSPGSSVTVIASPSATPSPTPSAEPGPKLTKSQFADLISTGKIGNRDADLKPASVEGADDPDGEGKEGEQQSEAKSCVKMYKLAAKDLAAQATDENQGSVMQLFTTTATAAELFTLNRACAAEQATFSPSTSLTSVAAGNEGSALWWLSKDPDASYQATVSYGNVLAYTLVDADTDAGALTRAFVAQVDQAAKG